MLLLCTVSSAVHLTMPWPAWRGGSGAVRMQCDHLLRWCMEQLKVGYVIFQKRFRKLSRAEYQNKLVANQQ